MILLEDPTTLSLLFHLNSEPWLNDEAYSGKSSHQEFDRPENPLEEIALPRTHSSLTELFHLRRSCRAFARTTMSLSHAAALLAAAYGVVDSTRLPDGGRFLRRSVPSAGGLFPLEVYAFTQRVEPLSDGLYYYDVLGHSAHLLKQGNFFPSLGPIFYTYPFFYDANIVICLSAVFKRTQKKYGPRGYRYILLEAGHSGQNICLRGAELGVATLCMGGFVDSCLNATLNLKSDEAGVVYTIAAGQALAPAAGDSIASVPS
jgi:SagB-type dehydrogenase family enzyme